MRRHDLDLASLLWGLLFLGVAAFALVAEVTGAGPDLDPRWFGPGALLALGAIGLLTSLSQLGRRRGERTSDPASAPSPPPEPAPERARDDEPPAVPRP